LEGKGRKIGEVEQFVGWNFKFLNIKKFITALKCAYNLKKTQNSSHLSSLLTST
jgi:hypothetical protein